MLKKQHTNLGIWLLIHINFIEMGAKNFITSVYMLQMPNNRHSIATTTYVYFSEKDKCSPLSGLGQFHSLSHDFLHKNPVNYIIYFKKVQYETYQYNYMIINHINCQYSSFY